MNLFWTKPSTDDVTPTDPLGLDAMRDELADRLVPCLTGRTRRHEDFYWCLAFIQWSSSKPSEKDRISQFLNYERWLKLCWANKHRRFAGSRRATQQASEREAPLKRYAPLLKNQRSQGLLGAHLQPLRKIGLVHPDFLNLTPGGSKLIEGAGPPISEQELPNGAWDVWHKRFERAKSGYGPTFKRQLRESLTKFMPWLPKALSHAGWRTQPAWQKVAHHLGPERAPYAWLAGEFIDWADEVRNYFEDLRACRTPETLLCPPRLKSRIPAGLQHWASLQSELPNWKAKNVPGALARIHKAVFHLRHYSDSDLWVQLQDGELQWRRSMATDKGPAEGSDCRWSNAVALLKP